MCKFSFYCLSLSFFVKGILNGYLLYQTLIKKCMVSAVLADSVLWLWVSEECSIHLLLHLQQTIQYLLQSLAVSGSRFWNLENVTIIIKVCQIHPQTCKSIRAAWSLLDFDSERVNIVVWCHHWSQSVTRREFETTDSELSNAVSPDYRSQMWAC